MRMFMYILLVVALIILELGFMPGLLGSAAPYLWIIVSLFLLSHYSDIGTYVAVLIAAAALGVLVYLPALILARFISERIFGKPNPAIFVISVTLAGLAVALADVTRSGVVPGLPVFVKLAVTAVTAIIILPVLSRFREVVSFYETKVRLPVR